MVPIRYTVLLMAGLFMLSFKTKYSAVQEPWDAPVWADTIANPYLIEPLTLPQAQEVFAIYCASCHGTQGDGNGNKTQDLKVKPRRFQDAYVKAQSDGALFWKIREGRGEMPSFKESLSEEQKWQMVEYIRDLSKPLTEQQNPLRSVNN